MEKQEFKSKWDELAVEIGAEISPETRQREEAASSGSPEGGATESAPREEKSSVERAPLPKRAAVDWNDLAGELGLPPAPPEPSPQDQNAQDVQQEELRREPPRREHQRRETQQREHQRREKSQERPARRPGRESRERRDRTERGRDDRERRGHRDKQRQSRDFSEDVTEERQIESADGPDTFYRAEHRSDAAPPPVEERPAVAREAEVTKPAAVSLWHKIFGSPTEQKSKLSDDSTGSDATLPSEMRDEPRDAGSGFTEAHPETEAAILEYRDEFEVVDQSAEVVEESPPAERQRGRSRRRRGRGRKRHEETAEDRPAERRDHRRQAAEPRGAVEDEFIDDDTEPEFDPEEPSGDMDSATNGDEGDARSGLTKEKSSLQKSIPSWAEAIGYIVDSNMQSRSQRRPSSQSSGHRGGSRGGRRRGGGRHRGQPSNGASDS
jgi:hypothetical protein